MLKKLHSYLFVDDLNGSLVSAAPVVKAPLKMRLMRDLAYLTLFSYILLVFNPVMPLIADKMAHTFWLKYHLLTVHEVNGKFHVHMELNKAANQSDKDKPSKAGSEDYVHLVSTNTYNFSSDHFVIREYPPYKFHSPVSYPEIDYQPPKV